MKNLKQLLCMITVILAALHMPGPAYSQPNEVDVNRMNRDINIMENILDEMFKTRSQSPGNEHAFMMEGTAFFGSNGGIRGTYLPDYGVIFTIPTARSPFVIELGGNDGDSRSLSYSFVYSGDDDADRKVTEESVVNRIREFLRDYASTIGQLDDDENVMVIYGANRSGRELTFLTTAGDRAEPEPLPTISAVAGKSDLDAYRAGRLSEADFNDRVSVSTADNSDDRQLDMKVMANIFETAFKNRDSKGFRIMGSVDHLKLDNFGALFLFDARYSESAGGILAFSTAPSIEVRQEAAGQRSVKIAREMKEVAEQQKQDRDKREEEQKAAVTSAYRAFKTQLRDFMVDYGRTLNSLNADQYVMVSVTLTGRDVDIPDRIDLQVKKSVLNAMDRGSMSREQALGQVVIREY